MFADDHINRSYNQQLINEDVTISAYRQGEFVDLCHGAHISHQK